MDISQVREALGCDRHMPRGAAVLIPLVETIEGLAIVLEVRARTLVVQPGEVCLPGGGVEPGETPQEAAVRETCEELLVGHEQIELLGELDTFDGPGGRALHAFVAKLSGYQGTFSPDEVDRTFVLPLQWLLDNDPEVYRVSLVPHYPDDYPWELVPGGRNYPWRARMNEVPFYLGTDPLVWGATARVLRAFAMALRKAERKPNDAKVF